MSQEQSVLLKKSMRFNAAFSAFTAVPCFLFTDQIIAWLGLTLEAAPSFLIALGISLILFAASLMHATAGKAGSDLQRLRISGVLASSMDIAWVIGSVALLLLQPFPLNLSGKWIIAIIAVFVLDFAILQIMGVKRLRSA